MDAQIFNYDAQGMIAIDFKGQPNAIDPRSVVPAAPSPIAGLALGSDRVGCGPGDRAGCAVDWRWPVV